MREALQERTRWTTKASSTEPDAPKTEGRYRVFADLERQAAPAPPTTGVEQRAEITVLCSNDYLGMGQNAKVIAAMHEALDRWWVVAANISGTNLRLELRARAGRPARQGSGPALHLGLCFELGRTRHAGELHLELHRLRHRGNHASMIEGDPPQPGRTPHLQAQ